MTAMGTLRCMRRKPTKLAVGGGRENGHLGQSRTASLESRHGRAVGSGCRAGVPWELLVERFIVYLKSMSLQKMRGCRIPVIHETIRGRYFRQLQVPMWWFVYAGGEGRARGGGGGEGGGCLRMG